MSVYGNEGAEVDPARIERAAQELERQIPRITRYFSFRAAQVLDGAGMLAAIEDPCPHGSKSGDEGPVRDLLGGWPVRWRCDECGAVSYDDNALAELRRLAPKPDRPGGDA